MSTNELDIVKATGGFALFWGVIFILLQNLIMPRFKAWRSLIEWQRIEAIMRIVAVLNGLVVFVAGIVTLLHPVNEPRNYIWWSLSCTVGYWVYDLIGNIYYYALLKKSFVLIHHCFSIFCGVFFQFYGVMHMGAIAMTGGPSSDIIDHSVWFAQRLGHLRNRKYLVHVFDTIFFGVMRLLLTNYLYLTILPVDQAFWQQPNFVRNVCYGLICFFVILNSWIFYKHFARLLRYTRHHQQQKQE